MTKYLFRVRLNSKYPCVIFRTIESDCLEKAEQELAEMLLKKDYTIVAIYEEKWHFSKEVK